MENFRLKILDDTLERCGFIPGLFDCDREFITVSGETAEKFNDFCEEFKKGIDESLTKAQELINDAKKDSLAKDEEEIDKLLFGDDEEDLLELEVVDNAKDETATKLNNFNVIKNISFDQTEILYNIMTLHNGGKPFDCDITASELKFYEGKNGKYKIPLPKYLFDVYPMDERVKKITPFQRLPFEDKSLESIVCDLPFVISPKKCKSVVEKKEGANMISNRFSSFYPMEELIENIYWWINECYRVLKDDGILVWKMQSTVSGGRQVWASPFSFLAADKAGFYVQDEFILEAKARLIASSKIREQKHARKYTSTFWVFKKDAKKYKINSPLNLLKRCEEQVYEGKVWEVK
jgi:hypothetical protein